MIIHFVTTHHGSRCSYSAFYEEEVRATLLSYFYRDREEAMSRVWSQPGSRVLLDSGAFSAFTLGDPIRVEEYAAWALDMARRWGSHLRALRFFNLDVIGDQAASWRNLTILRARGVPACPILTLDAGERDFDRCIGEARESGNFLAIGGLVALYRSNKGATVRSWLDKCFSKFLPHIRGLEPDRALRVHLLGLAQPGLWRAYPCYSADSSTCDAVLRFGKEPEVLGSRSLPLIPSVTDSVDINVLAMRRAVRGMLKLERETTALWERRGVAWGED